MATTGQIFSSLKNLTIGSTGKDVRDVQLSLNNRPPSSLAKLNPDGIFGKMTDARVREFQRNLRLIVDGIVGPQTIKALAGDEPDTVGYGCNCCNPENYTMGQPREFADFFRNNRIGSGTQFGFAGRASIGAPSAAGSGPLRMLTDAQKALAMRFYGASLDFSTIYISKKTGLGGRPFTIAFKDSNEIVQIMNCGTFEPGWNTLIHELAHAWQSQHHPNKFRYMVNAVDSQAGAVVASVAAAIDDPIVSLNKNFPTFYPFDAYAYNPGLPFSNMAAEQMAKAIENSEGSVLSHIKGITMNMIDPACVTALSKTGFADRRLSGVK
jgi:hypothetical protein